MVIDVDQITKLLNTHFRIDGGITINPTNGMVDVRGDVTLIKQMTTLSVKFGKVSGSVNCYDNKLNTLDGSPVEVGMHFRCSHNQLTNLKGAPSHVGGFFSCRRNNLVSLDGAPAHVGHRFLCDYDRSLPLLRVLSYQDVVVSEAPTQLDQILEKYAGTGRKGAFSAAKEINSAGEVIQRLQGLDHNPFERNARW